MGAGSSVAALLRQCLEWCGLHCALLVYLSLFSVLHLCVWSPCEAMCMCIPRCTGFTAAASLLSSAAVLHACVSEWALQVLMYF